MTAPTPAVDHRTLPRRRGDALADDILDATVAELLESGYDGLTMDAVARRAGASKASLYRRWPHVTALLLAALYRGMPTTADVPDLGSLRADVLALMRQGTAHLAGPIGTAVRGLLSESLRNPDVAAQVHEYSRGNSLQVMRVIAQRAVVRGECRPEALTDRRLEVGPSLLRQHLVTTGQLPDDDVLVEIVDEVVLPLLTAQALPAR